MKLKLLLMAFLFSICAQVHADWFLRGTHNGWAATQMASAGTNTVQVKNVVFVASGSFKIDRFGDWKESYGIGGLGGGNIPIAAGTWDITFFSNTKTWTIVQASVSSSSLISSSAASLSAISSSRSSSSLSSSMASSSIASSSLKSSSLASSSVISSSLSSSVVSSSVKSSSIASSSLASSSVLSSSIKSSSVSSSSVAGPRYHLRGTFNAWAEGDLFTPVAGSTTNFEICRNFVPDASGPRFKVDPNGGWGGDQFPAADVAAKGWSKIVISINGATKTILSNTNNMVANCGAVSSSSTAVASSSVSSSVSSSIVPSSSVASSSVVSSSVISSSVVNSSVISSSAVSSSVVSSSVLSSSLVSSSVASSSRQSSSVSSSSRMKVATLYYVHNDHLGTPQVVTNQAQQVVYMADYQPFGKLQPGQVNSIELYSRFPGQSLDSETGLYYNYFRDYDPSIGRYIESDPIGLDGGINTYAYTDGNPLKNSDPTGQFAILVPAAGAGEALGVALAVSASGVMSLFDKSKENSAQCPNKDPDDECNKLRDNVRKAKDKMGTYPKGTASCQKGMSWWQLKTREQDWLNLAQARSHRDQKCFDGGDDNHQNEQSNAWGQVSTCQSLL